MTDAFLITLGVVLGLVVAALSFFVGWLIFQMIMGLFDGFFRR